MNNKIIVIGGGAGGYFAAINCKENNPDYDILILEKSNNTLAKVKVSGGGRCNVTHACFDPNELIKFYPRGNKELLGPFHQFMTGDMIEWLSNKGIEVKIEDDNRVFPASNTSQTIIDCFTNEVARLGISIIKGDGLTQLEYTNNEWVISTVNNNYKAKKVLIAAGSSKIIWNILEQLGHKIISPVPSLFTFNIQDHRIKDIPGIAVQQCEVSIKKHNITAHGPVLITHWGLSGPAILKLSAWGARYLAEDGYQFKIAINWASKHTKNEIITLLKNQRDIASKQKIVNSPLFDIPKRLWINLCVKSKIDHLQNWADVSKKLIEQLIDQITNAEFTVNGKSTFKDEFVTAGGVDLNEINFKRFESKLFPNLFFAGEVLNIDAVTGGFNFQAAWTGSWIAAKAMAE